MCLSPPPLEGHPQSTTLGNPELEGGGQGSTHKRISCLVRNVRSWKANSDKGRQVARKPRPPRRLLPSPTALRGPHASSARTGAPRTWYSASSSLDRRLPEPPIAAVRAQLGQLSPGRRQLSHFRPRGRVPAPSPQQPLPGLRPRARPCLQCPGTLGAAQRASSRLPAGPGELEAGPGEEPDAPGRGPGLLAPPPSGRVGSRRVHVVQTALASGTVVLAVFRVASAC